MSENASPQDQPTHDALGAAPALPTAAPILAATEHVAAPASGSPAPAALPPETHPLLELIGLGLAPDADEATRAGARELWSQLAPAIATAASPSVATPVAGIPGAVPVPAVPTFAAAPAPTPPIAMAARALRHLPPDQLLDAVLQRLRAALPPGATVPTPKGIQFQLVPVPPPPGAR